MREQLIKQDKLRTRLHATRNTHHAWRLALTALLVVPLRAAGVDVNQLPPPASATLDFARDIKPIFEQSCFRCHGPEKPRSHFRLDQRTAALKGGDNNSDDILPGDSARSRLIHYVAQLVPEMKMPPPKKAEPLTPEQIGLLRAWIDQGANWGPTNETAQTTASISPTFRWISVRGDEQKFRELEGMKAGWAGGLEHFALQEQISPDRKLSAEGHILFDDHDAQLNLALEKADVGFMHIGVAQWRRYSDDSGGFYRPLPMPSYSLDRELYLEHNRAWIDFGLTLPNWPQLVLGYEYQSKVGAESTLQWGPVEGKNIYPSAKDIDEHTHIVKFDLTHELAGWHIEDNARVEFYNLSTSHDNAAAYTTGPRPDTLERVQEKSSHVQGANSIRAEKQLRDWWLLSGGYFFSKYDGDASLNQTMLDANYLLTSGHFWNTENITLRRDSHVFSLANLFLPVDGLSVSAGVQSEWTHQEGFGKIREEFGDPNVPGLLFLLPATISSDLDKTKTMENVSVRFTKVPHTVLFAEARLEQEDLGQFEREDGDTPEAFLRDTDAVNRQHDWRAGFNTSPWRWLSLSAHYRSRGSDTDYHHLRDVAFGFPNEGYSAFITARTIRTDAVQARLAWRPAAWLKTTFTYDREATDYTTATEPLPADFSPGGRINAGSYAGNVYGCNLTLTPFRQVYFSGTVTYSDTRMATHHPDFLAIGPYRGGTCNFIGSANYAVNARTGLQAAYAFSRANFGQNNIADGLPLGIDYTRHSLMAGVSRKFSERVTATLRYGFYSYAEPTSGGVNDYTAHGVFVTLAMKGP
jgi:mono/diheme cytochrome c family protein